MQLINVFTNSIKLFHIETTIFLMFYFRSHPATSGHIRSLPVEEILAKFLSVTSGHFRSFRM